MLNRNALLAIAAALLFVCCRHASADPARLKNINIILSGESSAYSVASQQIKNNYNAKYAFHKADQYDPSSTADLSIAIGNKACRKVTNTRHPRLCIGVTKYFFETEFPNYRKNTIKTYGIYFDPPLRRQLMVVKRVFPHLQRFSVLCSQKNSACPHQPDYSPVTIYRRNEGRNIIYQIKKMLSETDALIAIPDREVFNRKQLHAILLTAYRLKKPIIGYSNEYVRAGSLISTYSTPAMLGMHTAEFLERFFSHQQSQLPHLQSTKYFSVIINRSIAESLNMKIKGNFSPDSVFKDKDFAQ